MNYLAPIHASFPQPHLLPQTSRWHLPLGICGPPQLAKFMTTQNFVDAIAIGNVVPSPLVIIVAFIGFMGHRWAGGIVMTIGMFLPRAAFSFSLFHNILEAAGGCTPPPPLTTNYYIAYAAVRTFFSAAHALLAFPHLRRKLSRTVASCIVSWSLVQGWDPSTQV